MSGVLTCSINNMVDSLKGMFEAKRQLLLGISEEHLAHIAEPFYRTDSARQRQTGGFGLGLYLCRLIAEAHGGSLRIESQVGQGTTMQVLFPVG